MNAVTGPAAAGSATRAPAVLRARDVADLAVSSGYPCISVLLPTEPAPRMRPDDLGRLQALVAEAARQLREQGVTARGRLLKELAEHVRRSAEQPTDRALAIYVSLAVSRAFRLPHAERPRVVVEPTFAIRALVSALHRMPPHVVLVLHPTCAHLYAAAHGSLRPVGQHDAFRGAQELRLPQPGEPGWSEEPHVMTRAYLQAVDRMLGDYRAAHPSPLVLAGSPHLLDRFCDVSRHLGRLAGRVALQGRETTLDLVLASAEAIERYLRTRREDALDQLDRALRVRPGDVATGIDQCWHSLQRRAPGMLLVEENYISPGAPRKVAGPGPVPGPEALGTGEVHDLVDDLMEQVILRGGQLALVREGELSPHDRVALIARC